MPLHLSLCISNSLELHLLNRARRLNLGQLLSSATAPADIPMAEAAKKNKLCSADALEPSSLARTRGVLRESCYAVSRWMVDIRYH